MRNLQEQAKKTFCYQKLFWPFTLWINCSSALKIFANSWASALNFKRFSRSVGQNNFGNKIPFFQLCISFEMVLLLNVNVCEFNIWKNILFKKMCQILVTICFLLYMSTKSKYLLSTKYSMRNWSYTCSTCVNYIFHNQSFVQSGTIAAIV